MDLQSILASHNFKNKSSDSRSQENNVTPTISEIPDIFFDVILIDFKLSRVEIMLVMYLYRKVWCRPNLYKTYGIGPMLSLEEVAKQLHISMDDLFHGLKTLESFNLVETIRAGQFFVRKFFTADLDKLYGQVYDDF